MVPEGDVVHTVVVVTGTVVGGAYCVVGVAPPPLCWDVVGAVGVLVVVPGTLVGTVVGAAATGLAILAM